MAFAHTDTLISDACSMMHDVHGSTRTVHACMPLTSLGTGCIYYTVWFGARGGNGNGVRCRYYLSITVLCLLEYGSREWRRRLRALSDKRSRAAGSRLTSVVSVYGAAHRGQDRSKQPELYSFPYVIACRYISMNQTAPCVSKYQTCARFNWHTCMLNLLHACIMPPSPRSWNEEKRGYMGYGEARGGSTLSNYY